MTALAFARRLRRVVAASGFAALAALAGCGGETGCALAPGPCAGAFPDEHIAQPIVEPASITVAIGQTATFIVNPNGLRANTYQWYRAGPSAALAPVPGASGVSYSIVAAQRADDGATFLAFVESAHGDGRVLQPSTMGTLHVTAVP